MKPPMPRGGGTVRHALGAAAIVLLLHGGGFVGGHAGDMRSTVEALAARGVSATEVEYPLGSPYAAELYTRRLARDLRAHGRRVYAYGYSAGATIAAWLSVQGDVAGAVAIAPVTDLRGCTWMPLCDAWYRWPNRAAASPVLAVSAAATPLLIAHAVDDRVAPFAGSAWLALRDRRARLIALPAGDHLIGFTPATNQLVQNWLARRITLDAHTRPRRG